MESAVREPSSLAMRRPAHHAGISAVYGIAEHTFDGVLTKESEENRGLDLPQSFVLLDSGKQKKTFQSLQAFTVNLARRFFALIAEFGRGVFERRLCVAVTIAAVRASKLTVDVDGDASLACSRAGVVGGKYPRGCSGDD